MNEKKKLLIIIGCLVLVVGGGTVAYNVLADSFAPEVNITSNLASNVDSQLQDAQSAVESEATQAPVDESQSVVDSTASSQEPPVQSQSEPDSSSTTDGQEEAVTIPALDFDMVDSDGNAVKLSDYFGKPIVVNFWATWCPYCIDEMPDFENVYKDVGDDVQFIMLNATDGQRETVEKGKAYIEEHGYSFPVFYDTERSAVYTYGIRAYPTSMFIDADGNIVAAVESALTEDMLRQGISLIYTETES